MVEAGSVTAYDPVSQVHFSVLQPSASAIITPSDGRNTTASRIHPSPVSSYRSSRGSDNISSSNPLPPRKPFHLVSFHLENRTIGSTPVLCDLSSSNCPFAIGFAEMEVGMGSKYV